MKRVIVFLLLLIQPMFSWAESGKNADESDKNTVTMSALDAVRVAGNLVEVGDYDQATRILTLMPKTGNLPVEIERWYLLGQIERGKGNIDEAIRIFRKILDDQPDLVKIRYELAKCYMAKKQWYRADYHLRLAMAGADIPEPVKRQMMYYRYIARKNKNWNVWFNFGAVPDNNINQVAGGEECITNEWGTFCRPLPEPVSAIGYNLVLGGNYEFKLSEHWRWKSDANIYTNIYNKHDYDDFYLGAGTGPRYVWNRGDIWAAVITDRRWYGWDGYNQSWGGKLDMNYDFTRRFSGGLTLRTTDNHYDNYGHYLNGQTYSANARLSYSIDATKYVLLRGGADREDAHSDIYSNWRYGAGIGFGAELPFGFHVYVEPYFSWAKYDGARWVVLNHTYTRTTEDDFIQRYSLSLSNSKFDIWGFVPTVTFSYTRRDSNMPNREYDRFSAEFTMRQKF